MLCSKSRGEENSLNLGRWFNQITGKKHLKTSNVLYGKLRNLGRCTETMLNTDSFFFEMNINICFPCYVFPSFIIFLFFVVLSFNHTHAVHSFLYKYTLFHSLSLLHCKMLFARSIITISCIVLSVVNAAPIISSPSSPSSSSSKSYISEAGFLLTESLSEYYENIVDQVMLDVSEDVLTYLPQSISHGNVEGSFISLLCISII